MILILDDEPWFLEGYVIAFRLECIEARIVEDEAAFFRALEKDPVNAAIIDIMLSSGESSGLCVLAKLRQSNRDLPVVLLTNKQDIDPVSEDNKTKVLYKRDADPIRLIEDLRAMGVTK